MGARLGGVLYWIGCIAGFGWLALTTFIWATEGRFTREMPVYVFFVLMSLGMWLAGRACRYILAGR